MRVCIVAIIFGCAACATQSTPAELQTPNTLAPPEGPPPRARGGGPRSFEEIQRFSEAICSHEQKCGNVGPIGRYSSRTECVGAVSEEASRELESCQKGLEERLMACVDALDDQGCEEASTPPRCALASLCNP
jgi:hypothetical protein